MEEDERRLYFLSVQIREERLQLAEYQCLINGADACNNFWTAGSYTGSYMKTQEMINSLIDETEPIRQRLGDERVKKIVAMV